MDNQDITITKGTNVDIMEGVTFESNLPKEEQGHIEADGTVDVNKVGTYTITYKYIPKEGTNEGAIGEGKTRIYRVIEKPNVKLNTPYYTRVDSMVAKVEFISETEYVYTSYISNNLDSYDEKYAVEGTAKNVTRGSYIADKNKVILKSSYWGEKYLILYNDNNTFELDPEYHGDPM